MNEPIWKTFNLKTPEGRRALEQYIAEQQGYTIYHYDKDYAESCYYMLMNPDWDSVVHSDLTGRFLEEFSKRHIRAGERKTEAEAWLDCPQWLENTDLAFELAGDKFQALRRHEDCRFYADVGESWDNSTYDGSTVAEAIVLACCAWNERTRVNGSQTQTG